MIKMASLVERSSESSTCTTQKAVKRHRKIQRESGGGSRRLGSSPRVLHPGLPAPPARKPRKTLEGLGCGKFRLQGSRSCTEASDSEEDVSVSRPNRALS